MHIWGDKWAGWSELSKAENLLFFWGRKVGRISGQMKEKFGEIRWYAEIRHISSWHDIYYAGYHYYQWSAHKNPIKHWLNNLSKAYLWPIAPLYFKWQLFMYGFAYHMACRKFPSVSKEILACADHKELLFESEQEFLKQHFKRDADEQEEI